MLIARSISTRVARRKPSGRVRVLSSFHAPDDAITTTGRSSCRKGGIRCMRRRGWAGGRDRGRFALYAPTQAGRRLGPRLATSSAPMTSTPHATCGPALSTITTSDSTPQELATLVAGDPPGGGGLVYVWGSPSPRSSSRTSSRPDGGLAAPAGAALARSDDFRTERGTESGRACARRPATPWETSKMANSINWDGPPASAPVLAAQETIVLPGCDDAPKRSHQRGRGELRGDLAER